MRKIPEIAHDEALDFKEQALALISEDYERIVESGFLDKDYFYNNRGRKIKNFDEEVSQRLADELLESSSQVLTAYEVDRANNELNDDYSLADKFNMDKSYIRISAFNGDHINGEITFSNAGEVYIMTFDKNNKILDVEETEIDEHHEFFYLANHIVGSEFKKHTHDLDDIDIHESIYYFNTIDSNHYHSEEEYNRTANHFISMALTNSESHQIQTVAEKILLGEGESSYILIECEDDTFGKDFIVERDGNILVLDYENDIYEQYAQGEEFTFKGETFIAEPGVLETVEMQLDGLFDMKSSHAEIEYEEPEVKSKNKFKP